MKEDDITNALIAYYRNEAMDEPAVDHNAVSYDIYPESHYHHYGNRGAVDLYVYVDNNLGAPTDGFVYEIKSESAVRSATGANEIIRQFNRMRKFFFVGSDHDVPNVIQFELCFTPTKYNAKHIKENEEIYRSAIQQRLTTDTPDTSFKRSIPLDIDSVHLNPSITMRVPDPQHISPFKLFTDEDDILKDIDGELELKKALKHDNEVMFENYYNDIKSLLGN